MHFHNGIHVWKYCLRSTPVKPHTHHQLSCDQPYASCDILSIATVNSGIAHKDGTAKATTNNNFKNILRAYKWLSGKEFICQCRRHRRCGRCRFDPFPPGRSPGGGIYPNIPTPSLPQVRDPQVCQPRQLCLLPQILGQAVASLSL